MEYRLHVLAAGAALAVAASFASPTAQAASPGFVPLTSSGKVMTRCNPRNLAQQNRCRVASLPGEDGYTLVASRTSDIVKNDVVIGKLLDKVWKHPNGNYIFGAQLQLNANPFDLTNLSFNANDLFRQVLTDKPVSIAYFQSTAKKALKRAGRTLQGLNEVPPEDDEDDATGVASVDAAADANNEPPDYVGPAKPVRDNQWVDFRIDANAKEVSGPSSAQSPWLLVKTKAPAGYALKSFAIRLLSSDFADASEFTEIYLSGYQPN